MNSLLCNAMYELGRIARELESSGRYVEAGRIALVAEQFSEARGDSDEQLALARLRQLADELHERHGERQLLGVYETLALTPVGS